MSGRSARRTARFALVLVAHADDETLGAGGAIQHMTATGWDVQVVIMSDGIVRARGFDQDNRSAALEACSVLGIGEPSFVGIADQRFDAVPMADLANEVLQLGLDPDLIISHVDTDLNRDHRLTLEVARIIGRPKRKPIAILGCEVPATSEWNNAVFPVNYYVPITEHQLSRKIEAFAQYSNEIQPYPHPWSPEGLRLVAQNHGLHAGCGFAEAFQVMRGYPGCLPT